MAKKSKKESSKKGLVAGIIISIFVLIVIAAGAYLYLAEPTTGIRISKRTINGYDVCDYDKSELEQILTDEVKWDVKLVDEKVNISLENPLAEVISSKLDEAYSMKRGFQFEIELDDKQIDAVIDNAVKAALEYEVSPNDSEDIMKYDETIDNFVYSDSIETAILDQESLKKELKSVLTDKKYVAEVPLSFEREVAEISADDFKMISSFETTTTANSNRNTNVQNACNSVNGTVLLPGQSFSYNETLGERTEGKGYKLAGAYLNGEHVDQIGGGICQVSSTLFNAVFAANLQVDERHGHTFEPTYVKPGLDATVSYPKPDFQFTNNSKYPIGIRAHYNDRHVTVEIYGVPTLEEGVTRYMTSEKIETYPSGYVFEDNPALPYGAQQITKAPKNGSKWVTYETLEKDGEVIGTNKVYYTKYKGENGIVQRNLTLDNVANAQKGLPAVQPGQAVPDALVQVQPNLNAQPAAPAPQQPAAPAAQQPAAQQPAAQPQPAPVQ